MNEKIHSFGETNPDAECYKDYNDDRTVICGITIKREFVTTVISNITCLNCLKRQVEYYDNKQTQVFNQIHHQKGIKQREN